MYASLALAVLLGLPGDPPADGVGAKAEALQPDPAWTNLGRSLWFDPKAKRVILRARVVSREAVLGSEVRLMSSLKEVSGIPAAGKNLIIVAAVERVLHFRIFAGDGERVVDTDEKTLTEQARKLEELRQQVEGPPGAVSVWQELRRQIDDLRKRLESLWLPHDLTASEKDRVTAAVIRIVGYARMLEHLMCLKGTKEHEAILATDAVANKIHAALLLTGAAPGHPVRFVPKFEAPAGSPIGIELTWLQDGRLQHSDARQWVWDEKAKSPLAVDWVFAGSELYEDPMTKKTVYAADFPIGDVITVSNFMSSVLDLPMASSASDADRVFVTNTAKIPPLGTEVFVSLSPQPLKSKERPAADVKPRQ